jgi:hypothetical protein
LGILLPGLGLSTAGHSPVFPVFRALLADRAARQSRTGTPIRDSNSPQGRILKENLLVDRF